MAHLDAFLSNQEGIDLADLFQELGDWEHQLKHADIDFREVQP